MSIEAMRKALNYIENTEGELGIKLSCGDALREALAAQPPATPVETATKSAPVLGASRNIAERPPSSDAAESGADTAKEDDEPLSMSMFLCKEDLEKARAERALKRSSAANDGAEEAVRDWWYSGRLQVMTSKEAAQALIWHLAKCGMKIIRDVPQTVEVSPGTREWIIDQALWRMYEHGKQGRPGSAQCEVQYVTNLLNGVVTREPQTVSVTDAMVNAAAREMWNDRDARHGGAWEGRNMHEVCVIQTKATARAALTAALSLTRPECQGDA